MNTRDLLYTIWLNLLMLAFDLHEVLADGIAILSILFNPIN